MSRQNRYCCRCHRTTVFQVKGTAFTCGGCGVVVERLEQAKENRSLVGDPMRSYKTRAA